MAVYQTPNMPPWLVPIGRIFYAIGLIGIGMGRGWISKGGDIEHPTAS
jgi:hypothetical protein